VPLARIGDVYMANSLLPTTLNWRSNMRNELCPFRFVVYTFCFLGLFSLQAYAQEKDHTQDADHQKDHPNGIVQDWSRRHVVYPRVGPIQSLISLQHDPRAILSWQAAEREDWHREKDRDKDGDKDRDRDSDKDGDGDTDGNHYHHHGKKSNLHRDWSISLGTGTTAPAMYPAKYSFDVNATPSCTNDFVVYPVNVTPGLSQPNIVAFNNLYSGPIGNPGMCNRTPSAGVDDGVSATTIWSYNVSAGSGIVATSPALSLDGTKIAFVETGSGSTARFHVLAPLNGNGVGSNLQDVTAPMQISGFTDPLAPAAGSGTASDLILTTVSSVASDTFSSPFVVYNSDKAYVGNDSGTLFRVMNVFCTLATCGGAAPSLDPTWGSGGGLATGCSGALTGPAVDLTGNVFVGCSDGALYGFDFTGVALPGSGTAVGDGSPKGGIVDPPLVDVVNGFVYVVSGSSGESSVLVQFSANDLSTTPAVATLGLGGPTGFNLHAPAFNDAYFSSSNPANWLIYEWALSSDGTMDALYGVGFSPSHGMISGVPGDILPIAGSTPSEFSPVTEILNLPADFIVVSALESAFPNMAVYNVNDFTGLFPNIFPPTGTQGATFAEGNGTTGIVVDNVSASPQASSIYFGVPSSNTAVKLTQSGLN
jgi:hypothetical protein